MTLVLKNKRILVTGGAGFIGSALVRRLQESREVSAGQIVIPRSAVCDLRELENCRRCVAGVDVVFHLAATTGGISFSSAFPASQYYDSMMMTLHMLRACWESGVEKVIGLGNILTYPAAASMPLEETSLHSGKVASTHLGIGTAKRNLILMGEMCWKEYHLNVVNVLAANAYGPGDRFDPSVAHVIPATIIKCFEPGPLVVWGDGTPTRDFLYVDDIAEGLLLAAERLDAPDYVVNIASGREVSIKHLVWTIAQICGFKGEILFDLSKPSGDSKRYASTALGTRLLEFEPSVPLEEGLRRTVAWYQQNVANRSTARD
jgi:GDP-L-fucose synthase